VKNSLSDSSPKVRGKKERILVQTRQIPLQDTPFAGLSLPGLVPSTHPQESLSPSPTESATRAQASFATPMGHGEVILARETAHRGGKTVIIVRGFAADISDSAIAAWARQAKNQCACGGKVEKRTILLQGDIAPRVRDFFRSHGFLVRGMVD
jgi:translation initiation factor 1